MKYIKDMQEGNSIRDIYYCKQKNNATTKNGKDYWNVTLMDKTGTMDAKVWEVNSPSIVDFETGDFVFVYGDVTSFNGALQLNIKQTRIAAEGEYVKEEYFPVSSKDIEEMWKQFMGFVDSVKNPYLNALLKVFFVENEALVKRFKATSAARSVHHGFIGGLLEHSLSVAQNCDYMASHYPILNRDLLITAALLHDVGKTKEFSLFPENDYTDKGNLIGHIVIGAQMVEVAASRVPNFPPTLKDELEHCILAHHGKLEYGSPKVPALVEAVALNYADDLDAKMEIFTEIAEHNPTRDWQGYNRLFESNIRLTRGE